MEDKSLCPLLSFALGITRCSDSQTLLFVFTENEMERFLFVYAAIS